VPSTAGNPYAAPSARLGDTAPALGLAARLIRVLAFLGNAFLVVVTLVLFFSSGRSDAGFLVIAGYCVTVAVTSTMALAFRDRFSFWAGLGANVVGVLFSAVVLIYFSARGDSDWWTVLFIAAPTAVNLFAIMLVRRSRGPSDDTVASRR
jgi:1,4-dihydroxy-2-naphthoate octaprenyltransferase